MPIASDTCQQCGTVAGSEALHCDQNAPKLVATRPLSSQPFVVDMCIGPGDRYKIIKQLGAGGFGQAYLAEDTTLNRRCVVKQLRINSDWSLQDREFYEKRFQHEAQLIATANQYGHPHILDIYDYLAEIQCLVLQYVTERRLTDVYLSQDSLPEMEALSYIRDICSALIYLHSQAPAPILHLDVKPENILCDEEGRVWLIDFGSADRSGGEQTQSTTPLLVSVSKPYTPPEQERGAPEPRSDIYALARTLQVLLVGRVSNAGTSWNDALPTAGRVTSHQVRRVPDPSDPDATVIREASISELMPIVIPAMRPDIAALIRDGVAANVEDRPTAREFFARLEAIIDSLHVPSPPPPAVPPEPRPLVGRDTALLQYATLLSNHHLAVITGEPGIGKSALVAALAHRAVKPIFWHAFYDRDGFEAFLRALAGFLWHQGHHIPWRLLHTAGPIDADTPDDRAHIDLMKTEAIIKALHEGAYLLWLDDLHHLLHDARAMSMLRQVVNAVRTSASSILMTSLSDPTALDLAAETITLTGIDRDAAEAVVRDLKLSTALVDRLYAQTAGNPQFLTLAITAIEHGTDPTQLIDDLPHHKQAVEYLLQKVDSGLTTDEREVMQAVSALRGQASTPDVIEAMLNSATIWNELDTLEQRHLLTRHIGTHGPEYQQHTLVQTFYYRRIGRQMRLQLHLRAADYYVQDGADLLIAARQLTYAGAYERAARVVTPDPDALVDAGQAFALERLLAEFTAKQLGPALWVAVNLARSAVAHLIGDDATAQTCAQVALDQLSVGTNIADRRLLQARAHRHMGAAWEYQSPEQAVAWLREGLEHLNATEHLREYELERARLHYRLGAAFQALSLLDDATRAYQTSLHLFAEGTLRDRADVLLNLGSIACIQENLTAGRQYLTQALLLYERTGAAWGMLGCRHNLAQIMEIEGNWDPALIEYQKASDLAEQLGSARHQMRIALSLGILRTNQGDFDEARHQLTTCLSLARVYNDAEHIVCSQSSIADLAIRMGDWDAASEALQEGEARAKSLSQQHQQLPEIYRGQALLHLGQGSAAARQAAKRALASARKLKLDREIGMGLRVLALVDQAYGRLDTALGQFKRSLALLRNEEAYEAARTQLVWGQALLANGQTEAGILLLEQAQATFVRLGAHRDLAAANAAIASQNP